MEVVDFVHNVFVLSELVFMFDFIEILPEISDILIKFLSFDLIGFFNLLLFLIMSFISLFFNLVISGGPCDHLVNKLGTFSIYCVTSFFGLVLENVRIVILTDQKAQTVSRI